MKYPDDFDTPTFPAGKRIAVTRVISIAIMVVFLLITFACGFLLWAQKSSHIHPFLVSVNKITGQWEVVGHQHTDIKEMKTEQTLQESLIGRFLMYRFFVTEDEQFNATIWQACTREVHCNPEKETNLNGDEPCALFCLSGDATHKNFVENIMPIYQQQVRMGETWALDVNSVEMLPIDTVSANGGTWQIRATINSNLFGPIQILAYAQIARNLNLYPQTLGYYIKSFNAYKIS